MEVMRSTEVTVFGAEYHTMTVTAMMRRTLRGFDGGVARFPQPDHQAEGEDYRLHWQGPNRHLI